MSNQPLLAIGVMTGNSVDGVDVVLTAFYSTGEIRDVCSHFLPFDEAVYKPIRALQSAITQAKGDMALVDNTFSWCSDSKELSFDDIQDRYIIYVAQAIKELIEKANSNPKLAELYHLDVIDVIGFHGQTCDHCPPSRAGGFKPDKVYTVQIGNGQQLADLTGITVIYDFRSDDVMHGGEGAPLAPMHNQHLAEHTKAQGHFPITFCNAGNTGNLAHITHELDLPEVTKTLGWDSGPFNHYPDLLIRTELQKPCDFNGEVGSDGNIDLKLLKAMFEGAVAMENGDNYLLQKPPKSGDPNYYRLIPELIDNNLPLKDRVRTAEYFSAYVFVHSLSLTPENLALPANYAIFGGGWHNPITLQHFKALLAGDFSTCPILPEHEHAFMQVIKRIQRTNKELTIDWSNAFGFDGTVMEARIFADMARCRLIGKPFSTPDTTGAHKPIVGGIIRFPQGDQNNASDSIRMLLKQHNSANLTKDVPEACDPRWNRGSAGWSDRLDSQSP